MNSDGEPTPIRNLAPLRDAPPDLTAEKMIGVIQSLAMPEPMLLTLTG